MEIIKMASLKTSINNTDKSTTNASLTTAKILSILIPKTSTALVKNENRLNSVSTSTKPSTKSHHISLYILLSLLFVIICIIIIILTIYLFHWRRRQQELVTEESITASEGQIAVSHSGINNDTSEYKNSPNTSSLLSTQYNKSELSNTPKINYEQTFKDKTF
jgi:cytoskeletal protein RodZ